MTKPAQASEPEAEPETESFRNQDEITLGVLTAIERDANTSQRRISRELDVALGLANSYLKRCVRKGWIKIQQVPPRRYAYFLTPQGFSEKARLTGNYLSASFTFFRRAREQMGGLIEQCVEADRRRIAFAGVSELAEVGILCAQDFDVTLAGVIDPDAAETTFRGLPVAAAAGDLGDLDVVIVTDLSRPDAVFANMESAFGGGCVLAPELLNLSPSQEREAEQGVEMKS